MRLPGSLMNLLRCAVFVWLSVVVQGYCQTAPSVSISGIVIDLSGNPLDSVIVSLKKAGLSDTTGIDGKYRLSVQSTRVQKETLYPFANTESVRFSSAGFAAFARMPSCLSIKLFSITGAFLSEVYSGRISAGETRVRFPKRTTTSMVIVRCNLRNEQRSAIFFYEKDKSISKSIMFGQASFSGPGSGLTKQGFPDTLLATRPGYVPYARNITSYEGTINISMTPQTPAFAIAQAAAQKGIIDMKGLITNGSVSDVNAACGKETRFDSVSTYKITCEQFGYYKKIISRGLCKGVEHSEFLVLGMPKPYNLHYGLTFMTSIPGLCIQDPTRLTDTIGLNNGTVYANCSPSGSRTPITIPVSYYQTGAYFPFDTVTFNATMDSIQTPLLTAASLPRKNDITTIATSLKDTSILVNGACSLNTDLSNVTIVATDRIAMGPQVNCSYCRFITGTYSMYGGIFDFSMLWSTKRFYVNAGSYNNTQLICDDSILCTPNADFSKPNVWIARAHYLDYSYHGGIRFQAPVDYTGVSLLYNRGPGSSNHDCGIRFDPGSSFTGYIVTNSDFFIQDITLTGKFWAYDAISFNAAGEMYIQYLFGIKLNRLDTPMPFPVVSFAPAGYCIIR
jgi:hypothetical protein